MQVRWVHILAFATGVFLIPAALIFAGSEVAVFMLAPAMFVWITIPLILILTLVVTHASSKPVRNSFSFAAIAVGGFLLSSGLLLGALAVR